MNHLQIIEFKNQRLLTTNQLAEAYETEENNIKNNFNNNKNNFTEGKHYYFLQGEELKELKNQVNNIDLVPKNTASLYLWTERGANRHCKILETDKAWEQFDNLEETYFRVKENRLQDSYMIDDPIKRAEQWITENKEKHRLITENIQKSELINELKPKAHYTDTILNNSHTMTITTIAKDFGMSGQKMNEILHELGIQYQQDNIWVLYSKYHNKGYTHIQAYKPNHSKTSKHNTKWTQLGKKFIHETLKEKRGIIPLIESV